MIKVNNLNKYFFKNKKNEIHVLNDVTFDLPDRGLVVLLGPSGSGKTTFLNVLGGLDSYDFGNITYNENQNKKNNTAAWDKLRRENIGYVFQNYNLIPNMSVFDNIAVVLKLLGLNDKDEIEERVAYCLKAVNMYKYRRKKVNELSGGEQQRISIARALVKSPNIIIADEPTGNLDDKNSLSVMNIIKELSKDYLVVLVTHDKKLAHFYGDRIISFKDGKVIDDLINDDLLKPELFDGDLDTIYLKDLPYHTKKDNIEYYSDQSDSLEKDLSVRLIYKHGTLYLQVNGDNIETIKVTNNTEINVINNKRENISSDEAIKVDYSLPKITPNKSQLFTLKDAIKTAFKSLSNIPARTKMMFVALVISGLICAFAMSILGNAIYNKTYYLQDQPNNIVLKEAYDLDKIKEVNGSSTLYINPYGESNIRFQVKQNNTFIPSYSIRSELGFLETVNKSDIIYGTMPKNDFEVLVDIRAYEEATMDLTKSGIWRVQDLLNEEIYMNNKHFKVTGIIDSKARKIYATRLACTWLCYDNNNLVGRIESLEFYQLENDLKLLYGRLPDKTKNEVLAPVNYINDNYISPSVFDDGKAILLNDYLVSGIYDTDDPSKYQMLTDIDSFERFQYYNSVHLKVLYSSNPQKLYNYLFNEDIDVSFPYNDAIIQFNVSTSKMIPVMIIAFLIYFVSTITFYFMTRSSMLSKMREISVYRALGVSRHSLIRGYLVDSLLKTTISSLIGFIFGSLVVYILQERDLAAYLFHVNTYSIIIGIVILYVSNLLVTLLSTIGILRKKPAHLLYQYDI
ncbi:ABC transporter ATP-binding protein/permease [Acholeplasma sp. OttesenSCG-928-E16]|nr:ABC transporter ATP-binding protein/permease [Acholeplasma sp. OttesenSCG-928-E16]